MEYIDKVIAGLIISDGKWLPYVAQNSDPTPWNFQVGGLTIHLTS